MLTGLFVLVGLPILCAAFAWALGAGWLGIISGAALPIVLFLIADRYASA